MQRGLPDLIERNCPQTPSRRGAGQLLPTPTSGGGTGYLSGNRRDTWRPALELAVQGYRPTRQGRPDLPDCPLPTPTIADARSSANATSRRGDTRAHPGTTPTDTTRLLPTPRSSDARGPAGHGQGGADLRTTIWLLPTPKASDGIKGCPTQRGSKGDLTPPSAAVRLDTHTESARGHQPGGRDIGCAPTTGAAAADAVASDTGVPSASTGDAPPPQADRAYAPPTSAAPASTSATGPAWGPYAEAVARWEQVLGRPAPPPTQPGRHGKPVLAPAFVEWLMGLDAGWVTDVALPRTLALRVLGNGVVPQQAAVALHLLLCPHRWTVTT
jgi:DNA (cytosine-5)-methyltransferase 1